MSYFYLDFDTINRWNSNFDWNILSVLGALNSLNETEKEKTNKKIENISTKIIETEKTNE